MSKRNKRFVYANRKCVVPDCSSTDLDKSVSLHWFPTNPELRAKWLIWLNRPNFIPKSQSKICSKHFTYNSYEHNPIISTIIGVDNALKVCLVKNACPSLLNPFNEPSENMPSNISSSSTASSSSSQDTVASNSVTSRVTSVYSSKNLIHVDNKTATHETTEQPVACKFLENIPTMQIQKWKRRLQMVLKEDQLLEFASNMQDTCKPLPANHSTRAKYCQTIPTHRLRDFYKHKYVQTPKSFLMLRTMASQTD